MITSTITFAFILSLIVGSKAALRVHPDSPQCTVEGVSVKCDFEGASEEIAVMEKLPDISMTTKINMIQIYNLKSLLIPIALCEDVNFNNVESINFSNNKICERRVPNLRFIDSKANRVPRQVNILEITRSSIEKVSCDAGLQRLFISKSYVGELNAPWTVAGGFSMKIEDSTINVFRTLRIESHVFLTVKNSTFNTIVQGGLILGKDATAHISGSIISSEANAIVVKSGAKIILADTIGKIQILGAKAEKEDQITRRPPGVPQRNAMTPPSEEDESYRLNVEKSCDDTPMWVWVLPTVFASLEGIALIVMCGQKMPQNRNQKLKNDMEFGDDFNIRVDTSGAQINPSSVYNENYPSYPSIVKRR